MKKVFLILIAAMALAVGGYYFFHQPDHKHHTDEKKQLYTCPMHPQIIQDKPGSCPICGMNLVPVKTDEPLAVDQKKEENKTMYRSSMNPNEISEKPGKDSMGMEMIPFEVKVTNNSESPSGFSPVTVSKKKRELIGLGVSQVEMRDIFKEIRTSARIVPDETRIYHVTLKIDGWVERLFINQTGQYVKKGAPLLTIYSPALLAAQEEYLSTVAALDKLKNMPESQISGNLKELEDAAMEKLRLFDISAAQIKRLRETGKAERTMTIESPASGYVTEKTVIQGHRVMVNETLMTITDLSVVWGEADIYESDMPFVKVGMPARLSLAYFPGETFNGKLSFLFPFLDTETRTIKARIEIKNHDVILKPGMYADAMLSYSLENRLAVPESAVMRTGIQDFVFLTGKDDLITPQVVKLGVFSGDGYYEVISGLNQGDRVVTSANFLIDSESSLKASLQAAAKDAANPQ
jgi:RND family efflux transporter MFP subunit